MTEGSPTPGDDRSRGHEGSESESGPELVKVDPQPVEDDSAGSHGPDESDGADDSDVADDSGEGDEIAEADDSEDEDESDDEDEEPRLKYARLTPHMNGVYRNGDMTSACMVAGDKMVVGTHDGNIVSPPPCHTVPTTPID